MGSRRRFRRERARAERERAQVARELLRFGSIRLPPTARAEDFELGDVLDFLVDENPLKQGLFSPGHHIPVVAADEMYVRQPDFVLILAWNFAENIMQRHQSYLKQGGRFILPMPKPRIVS